MNNTSNTSIIIAASQNCPASTVFNVVKETEKAIQIQNQDIEARYAFPVWVPKSVIKSECLTVSDYAGTHSCKRNFFTAAIQRIADSGWKRVSLGLSCY